MVCIVYSSVYVQVAIGEKTEQGFHAGFDALLAHVSLDKPSLSLSVGKNTGVGCLSLLQGIFFTKGSNPGLPHCRWILYHLSHQGSPSLSSSTFFFFSKDQECEDSFRNKMMLFFQSLRKCHKGNIFVGWWILFLESLCSQLTRPCGTQTNAIWK